MVQVNITLWWCRCSRFDHSYTLGMADGFLSLVRPSSIRRDLTRISFPFSCQSIRLPTRGDQIKVKGRIPHADCRWSEQGREREGRPIQFRPISCIIGAKERKENSNSCSPKPTNSVVLYISQTLHVRYRSLSARLPSKSGSFASWTSTAHILLCFYKNKLFFLRVSVLISRVVWGSNCSLRGCSYFSNRQLTQECLLSGFLIDWNDMRTKMLFFTKSVI